MLSVNIIYVNLVGYVQSVFSLCTFITFWSGEFYAKMSASFQTYSTLSVTITETELLKFVVNCLGKMASFVMFMTYFLSTQILLKLTCRTRSSIWEMLHYVAQ